MPNKSFRKYVILSILAATLVAPHALLIKIVTDAGMDDFSYMALRGIITVLVCLPMIIRAWPKIKRNWKWAAACNIFIAIAVLTHTPAVRLSTASYTSILHLFAPIIFIITSAAIIKERLTARRVLGIAVAFVGASVMFALPLLASGNDFQFYPESTVLNLLNMLAFAFAMISFRKMSAGGVPLIATMGSSFILVSIFTAPASIIANGGVTPPISIMAENPIIIALIVYSAVVVEVVAHGISTQVYKKVGAFVVSAASYFGRILSIALPIFILQESLSYNMVIGAAITLAGVMIVDTKPKSARKRPDNLISKRNLHVLK